MKFARNKHICKRCGQATTSPMPNIINIGKYTTVVTGFYLIEAALHLCGECNSELRQFLKPKYKLTEENIVDYANAFGNESGKDLLLLAGPDGYVGDYNSMMKELEDRVV